MKKPDDLHLPSNIKWKDLSKSAQHTLITLEPEARYPYIRFEQLFQGWKKVQYSINKLANLLAGEEKYGTSDNDVIMNYVPNWMRDMHEAIDPLSQSLWDANNKTIKRLKERNKSANKRHIESLNNVLDVAYNGGSKDDIVKKLLDELEKTDYEG